MDHQGRIYTADDIVFLSAAEAVRKRPLLYFQEWFEAENLDAFPLEAACHAVDEAMDGGCNRLEFQVFEDAFALKYNAAMSLEMRNGEHAAETIMTQIFACRNEKKHLAVGEAFCKVGIATLNFAAEYCLLEVVSGGKKAVFNFRKGKLKMRHFSKTEEEGSQTKLVMKPDSLIFGDLKMNYAGVKSRIMAAAAQLPGVEVLVYKGEK